MREPTKKNFGDKKGKSIIGPQQLLPVVRGVASAKA